jgi:hypothetical protein
MLEHAGARVQDAFQVRHDAQDFMFVVLVRVERVAVDVA